jgi:cyanophycinase
VPAVTPHGRSRGFIVPIGGAEDKTRELKILHRFAALCGRRPRIVIIPTASRKEDTGKIYQDIFLAMDALEAPVLAFNDRSDCEEEFALQILSDCDGVFITGGNQLRLSTTLGGTSVAKLLRKRNAEGLPIGGTSAGAAIMPEHMISSGDEGPTPRAGMVTLAPGLGFSNKIMIDQHFSQRDRLGRLLAALALNPFAVGLGIDEDTAAFIGPDNVLQVEGSGSVTIIDPAHTSLSSVPDAERGQPIHFTDLRLHLLAAGGRFDLEARKALL